jgi:hypothetical protein
MFWLINKKGAYGARLGLVQVAKEIISGLIKRKVKNYSNDNDNSSNHILACDYKNQTMSCMTSGNILKRIINMMRESDRFEFKNR